MNSVKNGDLRCDKNAVKSVKGFTLIELIIVIAILGLLAGITSLAIMGFVRDARIETANNKAQQAYATIQNLMLDVEIDNATNMFDEDYITTKTAATSLPKIVSLEFYINGGMLDVTTLTLGTGSGASKTTIKYDDYDDSGDAAEVEVKSIIKILKKKLEDSIAADFTGYVYADICLEDFVAESVVYCEDKAIALYALYDASELYVDSFTKTGTTEEIRGTADIFSQKADYKVRGECIGYYPFMNDLSYVNKVDKTPTPK